MPSKLILLRKLLFIFTFLISILFFQTSYLYAQRNIEWFERDFDSAYCRHTVLYSFYPFDELCYPYSISSFHSRSMGKDFHSVSKTVFQWDKKQSYEEFVFDNEGWLIEQTIGSTKFSYTYDKKHRVRQPMLKYAWEDTYRRLDFQPDKTQLYEIDKDKIVSYFGNGETYKLIGDKWCRTVKGDTSDCQTIIKFPSEFTAGTKKYIYEYH